MPTLITPSVGRKVWYRPSKSDGLGPKPMAFSATQPLDATILAVWGDRMVNVQVLDIYGTAFCKTSVRLHQEGDAHPVGLDGEPVNGHVEWMPYQAKQAAKESNSAPAVVADTANPNAAA